MKPQQKSSVDLALAARGGDIQAMRNLLERHVPRLRAFVRLRAGAAVRLRESTSDLVQSVCREALLEMPDIRFDGEAAFRHWLYRAAERKVVDRARYWGAEKRNADREAGNLDEMFRVGDERLRDAYRSFASPSHEAAVRDEVKKVEEAFTRLPEHYREVITLSRIVGLSHAEIAERMDRGEGAVRMILMRALAELSEELNR